MNKTSNADLDSFLADAGAPPHAAHVDVTEPNGPRRPRSQPITLTAKPAESSPVSVPNDMTQPIDTKPSSKVSTSSKSPVRVGFLLMDPSADSEITDEAEAFIKKLAAGKFTTEQDFINGTRWLSSSTKASQTAYRWFSQVKDAGLDVNLSHAVRWMTSSSVTIPLTSGKVMEIKKNVANLNISNDDFDDIAKILIASAKASGTAPTIWGDDEFTTYISNEMSKNGLKVKVITIEAAAERGLTPQTPPKDHASTPSESHAIPVDPPKILLPDSYNPPRQTFKLS